MEENSYLRAQVQNQARAKFSQSRSPRLGKVALLLLLLATIFINQGVNGASCTDTFDFGSSNGNLDTHTIPSGSLISSISIRTDQWADGSGNPYQVLCQLSGAYKDNAGDETSFAGSNLCTASYNSYTLNLNTGERITRINTHLDGSNFFRWISFETLQPATYALGDTSSIQTYPTTDSYALEGPITQIQFTSGGSWRTYLSISHDRCSCVTVQPELQTIPNFTWTFGSVPEDFTLDAIYPADPSWPLIDPADNDCWATFGTPSETPATYQTTITTAGVVTISNPSTENPTIVFDDSGIAASDINSLSSYLTSNTIDHEEIMIEFTVTVTMTTGSSWYVEDNTGSIELTASQTFTVQILNPCTATDLTFDSYSASVSVVLGDSDTSTTVDITSASATYSDFCADTYYYDDGGCSFCTKALSGTTTTFTIAPSDDETNVGTYILQLHACYENYLNYCSPPVTVTVTITSDCGTISGGTFTDPSAIAVFDTSADVTIARCTTTSSNTADCAMEWSIESDPDTPSMISITQPTDLTAATGSSRKVSFTSNDFDDVGTHTFTVSCWYTNYPTTNTVSNTLTLTVNDCSSSSSCSCTQLSISGDADWGDVEYI